MNNTHIKALIVDGENVNPKFADAIIDECECYDGELSIRRVYGIANKGNMGQWQKPQILLKHGLSLHLVEKLSKKNSSDIAMMLDIMLMAVRGMADTFIIVTSDRDFMCLNYKLKELGKKVIGLSERGKSSEDSNYAISCSVFKYLDNLSSLNVKHEEYGVSIAPDGDSKRDICSDFEEDLSTQSGSIVETQSETEKWTDELCKIIKELPPEDGCEEDLILCSKVGELLKRKGCPSYKSLGYKGLKDWLKATGYTIRSKTKGDNPPTDYIVI